jgi:hypothetical protein
MDAKTKKLLADWGGPTIPFKYRYAALRPCSSALNGDVAVVAEAAQFQTDNAALGASSTFGCNAAMVMVTG